MSNNFFGAMAGAHAMPTHKHQHAHSRGFCASCCHPAHKCCCGSRDCMKEPKELLVVPEEKGKAAEMNKNVGRVSAFFSVSHPAAVVGEAAAPEMAAGKADAIIGGGCCVHLSIEYMPNIAVNLANPANQFAAVLATVVDSEGTVLAWGKYGAIKGYHVKECIITTNPGAKLEVIVINAIARVRWCEVFSC